MNNLQILILTNALAQLLATGLTTIAKVRDFLKQEGATPEQLAELDVQLSDAIAAREAEAGR